MDDLNPTVELHLHRHRLNDVEEAVKTLSSSMSTMSETMQEISFMVRNARWVILGIFGILQPAITSLIVAGFIYLIKGGA